MTDREKLNAIRAEVEEYIDAARKAHTNITEGNFAHLLSFIDSLQEEPVSEDLEEAAVEAFKQIVDSDKNNFLEIFKAGANWKEEQMIKGAIEVELNNTSTMTKNEEIILRNLVKTLQDYENECYRQMAYMNEHKFEMEREAIRYKQQAYNRSWLEVAGAIDKIKELEE